MLRIEPLKEDQAPSAILELVDGERDMRFAMTAKTLARLRMKEAESEGEEGGWSEMTSRNVKKVTRFRKGGEGELERAVGRLVREERRREGEAEKEKEGAKGGDGEGGRRRRRGDERERVYPRE